MRAPPRRVLTVDPECRNCKGSGLFRRWVAGADEYWQLPCHCLRPADPPQQRAGHPSRAQQAERELRATLEDARARIRELVARVGELEAELDATRAELAAERAKPKAVAGMDPRIARAIALYDAWRKHPSPAPATVFLEELLHSLVADPPNV